MAEYIDREKIRYAWWQNQDGSFTDGVTLQSVINDMPTEDVQEVKHGYWKDTEYGTCSVCDRSISEIYDAESSMSYGILDELTTCPFCGAKMDGDV